MMKLSLPAKILIFIAAAALVSAGFPSARAGILRFLRLPPGLSAAAPAKERVNFLLLGADKSGSRTDAIIAGSFDTKTGRLGLLSIPRDTRVQMPQERREAIEREGRFVPESGYMKLNQVYHYAGAEHGLAFAQAQTEELLGVKFDYRLRLGADAFRALVDKMGGVTFNVPQRMIYDDPEQGLHIDLYPGEQLLSGAQAEGLVRYRHGNFGSAEETRAYPMADLDRVEVQREFLSAALTQLSRDKAAAAVNLLTTLIQYGETDFPAADAPKYARYLRELKPENITSRTLPCSTQRIGGADYAVVEEEKAEEIVREIFFGGPGQTAALTKENVRLTVLNGGYTEGAAAKTAEELTRDGWTVESVGNFEGVLQKYTRILIRDEALEREPLIKDLSKIFPEIKIEVDNTLPEVYNIVIIIGTEGREL
ncbi:MAG: LCP family protein [Clostridiales bacterium]|jgi:LCP family protein required for cell wall assembly|nr:LCP family protein [Clostridiales bacterium]